MGILDFALHPGQKFTDQEINILDKNFCSINDHTNFKYEFDGKLIDKDIISIHGIPSSHEILYRHNLPEHENMDLFIACKKYRIRNQDEFDKLNAFYKSDRDDLLYRLIVPEIKKFPKNLLQVGHHGFGFFTILEYINNGVLTEKCKKLIRKNSIKYLKYLNSNELDIKFE